MFGSTSPQTRRTQGWWRPAELAVPLQTDAAGWGQTAFATLATLILLGVNFGLNPDLNAPPPTGSNLQYTLLQSVLLVGSASLVLLHGRRCLASLPALSPFLLLLLLALFSSLWSQSPGSSARRAVSLGTLLAFALYAHAVLGTVRTCRIQLGAMWIAALASLFMAAAAPASGFDVADYAGAIRGVFPQKNGLGEAMTVGMLALSYVVLSRRRVAWFDGAHVILSLSMTMLAQSTTSLLLSGIIVGVTLVALAMSRGAAWAGMCLLLFGGAAVGFALALALYPDAFFGLIGKDMTLTGRTAIWAAIGRTVGGPTPLGYGYSAFWLPTAPATQLIWADLNWTAPSAHSGYLDTLLELGTVGLGLVVALGLLTLLLGLWALVAGCWVEGIWALTLLAVLALFNADESSLPRPDIHQFQWVLAFMTLASAIGRRGAGPLTGGPR